MRSFLELLPGSDLSDAAAETDKLSAPLDPPDDDDLIRPAMEEELERFGESELAKSTPSSLAKHLLWTFGPIHPALPFLLQLRCEIEHDRLVTVDPEVGWQHQGLEKRLEATPWAQAQEIFAWLHPPNPWGHELAWLLALERLCQIEPRIPPLANLWRSVISELSRTWEHLMVLSQHMEVHGTRNAQRVFFTAFKLLKDLMRPLLWEENSPVPTFGGLKNAPSPTQIQKLRHELPELLSGLQEFADVARKNPSLLIGLAGLGEITQEDAICSGLTGPALRAVGLRDDIRVNDPYFAFRDLVPRVPERSAGDARARFEIRLEEVLASSALILRALATIDDLDSEFNVPAENLPMEGGRILPPRGRSVASVELPNGEFTLMLDSDGGDTPNRVRIRTPSFSLASALGQFLRDATLDEIQTILTSLGMLGAEIDR